MPPKGKSLGQECGLVGTSKKVGTLLLGAFGKFSRVAHRLKAIVLIYEAHASGSPWRGPAMSRQLFAHPQAQQEAHLG